MAVHVIHHLRVKGPPPQEFKRALGRRLKQAREARGMTQAHLATLLRCRQPTISEYEKGKTLPSLEVFWRISEILGVGMSELAGQHAPCRSHHGPPKASPIKSLRR